MIDYRSPRRPYFAAPMPNMEINVPMIETPMPNFDPRIDAMHKAPEPHWAGPPPEEADPVAPPPPVRSVLKRQEGGPADTIRRLRPR